MNWHAVLLKFWPHFAAGFDLLACLLASGHALLQKRDTRAATIWIGLIWALPALGPLLYLALGVNRIRRHAIKLGVHKTFSRDIPENLGEPEHDGAEHLKHIARVVSRVATQPLTAGNKIEPLVNGDAAFPAMLAAIEAAKKSVTLCTYIFDNDASGIKFVAALERAVKRGVAVRVLIDSAGTRYSFPPITWKLRRAKIPFAKFLPASIFTPWRVATINLRNHRKTLIVDGQLAFTGGMNIRESADFKVKRVASIADVHFRVAGPVVAHLQQVFADDWEYSTGESLTGDTWFPGLEAAGDVLARGLSDGPDEDHDKLRMALLGALACAESRVQIITPYFLPDASLITSLNVAAMRGVQVDILLPRHNNLSLVQWASTALLWQVLEYGCRVWLVPPPFEHTKLMLVDRVWSLVGSGNWDPRSLRLNFEFNVECYDRRLAESLGRVLDEKQSRSQLLTPADVDSRPLPIKLRDGVARLLSPYL